MSDILKVPNTTSAHALHAELVRRLRLGGPCDCPSCLSERYKVGRECEFMKMHEQRLECAEATTRSLANVRRVAGKIPRASSLFGMLGPVIEIDEYAVPLPEPSAPAEPPLSQAAVEAAHLFAEAAKLSQLYRKKHVVRTCQKCEKGFVVALDKDCLYCEACS